MSWTQERQTINQKVQMGAESTTALGTSVPASKLVQCFSWTFQIEADVVFYTPTGRKYAAVQEENMEWTSASLSGTFDYNCSIYPLAGAMGSVAPVAHGSSLVAKDWIFSPPLSGSIVPQTYTIQQGDSTHAHGISYGLFTDWGYKGTRKDFTTAGKLIGQKLSDPVTLTASPTAVVLAPVVANQVNVYLDSTSAGLGTTQLLRVLAIEYDMSNIYAPLWVLNRATPSYTAHVDTLPKSAGKLKVEADTQGMSMLANLQSGVTQYLRVDALGTLIDNLQTVSLGAPSAGTFTLTYKAQTTAGIAFNATAAAVQTALTGLSTVGVGNATVSGAAGGPYIVDFGGTLANDTTALTGNGTGLTGGTFLITPGPVYNEIKHDMAIKFGKPTAFADDAGVFAIEWTFELVEDSVWGHSQLMTVTNLITAL